MENQTITTNENEEISIIDLFAVLIRYRKLIILGTIIPSAIAAIYLFIVKPRITTSVQAYEDVTVTYTVRLNYMPQKLIEGIGQNYNRWWDWNGRILYDFINPTIIGPLYEKNQFSAECAEGTGESYIKPFIDSKKINCVNSLDTTYTLTINMPQISEEKMNAFMTSFLQYEHDLIQNSYMGNHLELLTERCQRKLKEVQNANPSTVNFDEIQKAKDILQDIETYKRENKPFYEIQGKPVINKTLIQPSNGLSGSAKIKRFLIVFFGSLILFTFIAFFLNIINSIIKDPEASKKIKDAWNNGK